jgi:hypothetical protein
MNIALLIPSKCLYVFTNARYSLPKEHMLQVISGRIFFQLMQHYKTGRSYRAVGVKGAFGPPPVGYACCLPPGMRLVNQLVDDFCEPFN